MFNFVVSPSQQASSIEQSIMYPIGEALFRKLQQDNRFNPYLIPKLSDTDNNNLYKLTDLSNEFIKANGGDGYHLALHADAGYDGTGASGFYMGDRGKTWGQPIYDRMCKLTPWQDMAFKLRPELYELKYTIASTFLLEVSFYDKSDELQWMKNSVELIANEIYLGILDGLKLSSVEPDYKKLYTGLKLQNALIAGQLNDIINKLKG